MLALALAAAAPSVFRVVPQDSCDADTRTGPTYPYSKQSEAIAACQQEGCTGLGSQDEQIAQGERCVRSRNLDSVGYFMESAVTGCGGKAGWKMNCGNPSCLTKATAFCRGCSPCSPSPPPISQ